MGFIQITLMTETMPQQPDSEDI